MGGLFGGGGGGQAAAPAPAPTVLSTPEPAPAPAVMPTIDDSAVKLAKKKSLMAAQQRGGRAATVLTDGEDKLG